ncbi:MAG: YitT family protein [Lachnospiraceae bacterium]|nr:YitT family protein [Lachnospiraceae bacterium]
MEKAAKRIKDYIILTAAACLYAAAVSMLLDPNDIAPGGVTGIAILLNRFVQIPTGTINLLLNVPIVALGLWKFGVRFICSTMYALALITVFMNLLSPYGAVTDDLLIAAVLGGALIGAALALVFRSGATTGGVDIIVKVLRTKWKHIKTNVLFLAFDSMVIIASWLVFGDLTVAFYAGIAVVVSSVVMDKFLYGSDEAKLFFIIGSEPAKMKQRIMSELDITATIIPAVGAYTGNEKEILMVVTRKQMAPRLEEIVKDEDISAFMIITSANEIYGEGYKDITGEKL